MILLNSLTEYVVVMGLLLLMAGLARLAYGGEPT